LYSFNSGVSDDLLADTLVCVCVTAARTSLVQWTSRRQHL